MNRFADRGRLPVVGQGLILPILTHDTSVDWNKQETALVINPLPEDNKGREPHFRITGGMLKRAGTSVEYPDGERLLLNDETFEDAVWRELWEETGILANRSLLIHIATTNKNDAVTNGTFEVKLYVAFGCDFSGRFINGTGDENERNIVVPFGEVDTPSSRWKIPIFEGESPMGSASLLRPHSNMLKLADPTQFDVVA